ncbi:uncharacterized protein METZ01_LOCUS391108 [marine metagenome]|uniref:Uncharacterized protein n=1 Tax=marine metagenome TaxID=408172 RepID=A0A382UVJ5_9ZZZZ
MTAGRQQNISGVLNDQHAAHGSRGQLEIQSPAGAGLSLWLCRSHYGIGVGTGEIDTCPRPKRAVGFGTGDIDTRPGLYCS